MIRFRSPFQSMEPNFKVLKTLTVKNIFGTEIPNIGPAIPQSFFLSFADCGKIPTDMAEKPTKWSGTALPETPILNW